MTDTPQLGLPYIDAAQAQKHVTHNEALRILDACAQLAVATRANLAPPAAPVDGERYLIPVGATGAFAGHVNDIAVWQDGAWRFLTPRAGWLLYVVDEQEILLHDGTAWVAANPPPTQLNQLELLGLGTSANAANPLSAKLNAALFTARSGGEGGSGHLRMAFNKSAAANVGSHIFQTNYSARAELGLVGDDNFKIAVSADGLTFKTVLQADAASGIVSGLQVADASFQIRDEADASKIAQFQLSGLSAATTRTYTLPNATGALATTAALAQTFTGATTFSGAFTYSGVAGAFGASTASATYSVGAGATISGAVKTIAIGTAGLSGSTTSIQLGPTASGAAGAVVVNTPLRLAPQAAAPSALTDGDVWYDAVDKLFRCRANGRSAPMASDETPALAPDAGRYVRTTTICSTSCANNVGAADRMEIYPFVPRFDMDVDRLAVSVVTAVAGALGDIVVYGANADGRPDALILETPALDLSTAGAKEVAVVLSFKKGKQYWLGMRSSSTATLLAWQQYNTPDLDYGSVSAAAAKVLRRTLAYATPAPASWGYVAGEATINVNPPAIWLRVA